jgi:hypothetical protein
MRQATAVLEGSTCGQPPRALVATLGRALLREDAGFHACQMLEAGVRQFEEWGNTGEGRHILIAVARYLAAHSPTERSALQTADIARRLMRGGELHQEATATEDPAIGLAAGERSRLRRERESPLKWRGH